MNLIHGDCLEKMAMIQNSCVDIIITSPPYNLGKTHHTGNYRHSPYADNMPENEYQEWQKQVLKECFRILKEDGSMFYNHKNRIRKGIQITPYEWLLQTDFVIKQEIVWFNGSQNFDKIRFYPMTERVYWLTKSPKTKMFNAINHHDFFSKKEWSPVKTKGLHTRAYPLKMVEDILLCFEDANVVFDPYMGSGTTGVACVNLNRKFIGIELNKEYFDLALKRIKEASICKEKE